MNMADNVQELPPTSSREFTAKYSGILQADVQTTSITPLALKSAMVGVSTLCKLTNSLNRRFFVCLFASENQLDDQHTTEDIHVYLIYTRT